MIYFYFYFLFIFRMPGAVEFVKLKIQENKVLIFAKRFSPESKAVIGIFQEFNIEPKAFEVVNLDERQDASEIENYLHFLCLTDSREVCYHVHLYSLERPSFKSEVGQSFINLNHWPHWPSN